LRLLYELRPFLNNITNQQTLVSWAVSQNVGIGLESVEDLAEIPSFGTTGPVMIEFSTDVDQPNELCRLRMRMDRETLGWTFEMWRGPRGEKVSGISQGEPPSIETHGGRAREAFSTEVFRSLVRDWATKTMYIPAFRNLINQGGATHYDIVVAT